MSTDPAAIPAIPAMTVTSTALGFGSTMTTPRPAHRAVMTAEGAAKNLGVRAGYVPARCGDHYIAMYTPAALAAEEAARVRAGGDAR